MVQLSTTTPTLRVSAAMHGVTDGRTDRRTDCSMMPIAQHTVQQNDPLTRKLSHSKDDRAIQPSHLKL